MRMRLPHPADAHARRKAISAQRLLCSSERRPGEVALLRDKPAIADVAEGSRIAPSTQVCRLSTREPLKHDERRHVDAYRDDGSSNELAKIRETAGRLANGESVGNGVDPIRVLAGLVQELADEVERGTRSSPDHGPTAPLENAPED
jgi:hypothetical protein